MLLTAAKKSLLQETIQANVAALWITIVLRTTSAAESLRKLKPSNIAVWSFVATIANYKI